jgi:hypothetical protein
MLAAKAIVIGSLTFGTVLVAAAIAVPLSSRCCVTTATTCPVTTLTECAWW